MYEEIVLYVRSGMTVVADAYDFVGVDFVVVQSLCDFEDIFGRGDEFLDVIGGCTWTCPCVSSLIMQQIDFANFSFPALTKCKLSVLNS